MDERTELYQYLYDLQGYLVIEDVLDAAQVAALNAAVDERLAAIPADWEARAKQSPRGLYDVYRFGMAGGSYDTGPGFLDWGQPFVDLLDHQQVMEILRLQLGDCFRLDRIFGMRMVKGMPSGRLHSDYGASEPFTRAEPGRFYPQPSHQALHGFAVAAFNLTDSGPETGGLCCIPGSHNSHFKLPRCIRAGEFDEVVCVPRAPAGSVTIFTEATTHGTAAWKAGHERRTLLYKYCASALTWSPTRVTAPEGAELTYRQSVLLKPPAGGRWFFPSVFDEPPQDVAAD